MPHSSQDVYGKFEEEVRLYKGTPHLALTQDFYDTNRDRGFARGARPVEMVKGISKSADLWGDSLCRTMMDYNFYGRITLVGEVLPDPHNQVTLSSEKDKHGMPIREVLFSYGANGERFIAHAVKKMKEIVIAAGGTPEFVTDDTAHLMGECRMGNDRI